MLVLTRKLNESLRIGDDIKITVLRVKGNTVRIGIEAPRDVRVVRSELSQLIAADCCPEDERLSANSPTIDAVVDSPKVASPRLFVGKVSRGGNRHADAAPKVTMQESEIVKDDIEMPPLREFFRSARGLTAV